MTMLNTEALPTSRRYKIAREVSGLRQEELAAIVGVSRTTIGDWEAGRTEPAFSKLVALARATNQPLDWFAEGLETGDVRPKGLEPPTFWFGACEGTTDSFWTVDRVVAWWEAECQVIPDAEITYSEGMS